MDVFTDITVLSLEQATVLPYLTYRLVQDGVRVIRLEHPVYGDPNRMIGDNALGEERMNTYYLCINSGKEALTLNLGEIEGRDLLRRLIVELGVDVFATNQLPKNYDKLGISYEILSEYKSDLIWVGVTGFGPERNEAAYDPILQGRGGLMELTGEADGAPQVVGIPLPDMGTSEHAYGQIIKALYKRAVTGRGSRIDLSMLASVTSWLTVPITLSQSFGRKITRRGNTHEFFAPVSVYPTKDAFVYLAVGNDKQWGNFIKVPGFESLENPDYVKNKGRIADVDNLNKKIEAITRTWDTGELIETLKAAGMAIAKISTIDEVAKDPYIAPNLLRSKDEKTGQELTLAPPPVMTEFLQKSNQSLSFPPRFGEHNQAVYGGALGLSDDELAKLKEKGVI